MSNAPQDLYNGRAWVAGFGPNRAREEIEDGAPGAAAVVQDRGTMAIMGSLIGRQWMPLWTVQSIRMQNPQQEVVAGLFIQQVIERKLQHQ